MSVCLHVLCQMMLAARFSRTHPKSPNFEVFFSCCFLFPPRWWLLGVFWVCSGCRVDFEAPARCFCDTQDSFFPTFSADARALKQAASIVGRSHKNIVVGSLFFCVCFCFRNLRVRWTTGSQQKVLMGRRGEGDKRAGTRCVLRTRQSSRTGSGL